MSRRAVAILGARMIGVLSGSGFGPEFGSAGSLSRRISRQWISEGSGKHSQKSRESAWRSGLPGCSGRWQPTSYEVGHRHPSPSGPTPDKESTPSIPPQDRHGAPVIRFPARAWAVSRLGPTLPRCPSGPGLHVHRCPRPSRIPWVWLRPSGRTVALWSRLTPSCVTGVGEVVMGNWYEKLTIGLLPEGAARRWGPREALAFQGSARPSPSSTPASTPARRG